MDNMQNGGLGDMMKNLMDQLKQDDSVIRAQMNDQRIEKVTEYELTKGYTKKDVQPEQLQAKFSELKGLIKRGEFTLKQLEDDIYAKWGISEEPRVDALKKEQEAGTKPMGRIGFNVDDLPVLDVPEDSPKNH